MKTYVKAFVGQPTKLGDCPFSHRVLLTLETKKVPYTLELIDFSNKPDWLQARSEGKVPVINDGDFWLPDSDKISAWLEEKYPEPSMASNVPPEIGGRLFPTLRQFMRAAPEDVPAKQAAFEAELKLIEDYLTTNGPFLGGATLNATDASAAPKLYHASVALPHFKGYDIPVDKFPHVLDYLSKVSQLPAWKAVDCGKDAVIAGWTASLAK